MKQKQNLACTLIHLLPLFHLFVAAKRSPAGNTPLQDHTVLWMAGIIFSSVFTFTINISVNSSSSILKKNWWICRRGNMLEIYLLIGVTWELLDSWKEAGLVGRRSIITGVKRWRSQIHFIIRTQHVCVFNYSLPSKCDFQGEMFPFECHCICIKRNSKQNNHICLTSINVRKCDNFFF